MSARIATALVMLLIAGCSGDESPAVPADALPKVVLQPADLPSGFQRFDEGRLASADDPAGAAGWKSRYRRAGNPQTQGPLVVESRVDLFDSAGDAEDELDAIAGAEQVQPSDHALGDEAIVVAKTQAGFPRRLATYVVAWRSDNVLGRVTANGFEGRLREADALDLARKQQARIAAAAR
jgi:hypothetical protein